jgi:hypothetical protein
MRDNKYDRLIEANLVIGAIAAHGRRFFYSGPGSDHRCHIHPARVAMFEIDRQGRLRFRDDYTDVPVLVTSRGEWKGFSHGGTLKRLVRDLADYIRTGKPISPGHCGPWPSWQCGGDLWGYGQENMELVRSAVLATDAVRKPAQEVLNA